ncbi:MAG: thiolase family protein [Chloroflexi bacterium]|nr:thiolase family protein [Chloroflexota bacterium]MBM3154423.1 thiolase family protein [Chloroflexota bacterium]MBM3175083.1 thiolase family protein [Chloroflexota bacterium]MBM4449717.1 thiolase family protein [Chloroflexota bacterium]
MPRKVGVVAVAQTKYEAAKPAWREAEITYQVVERLLQETGLTFAEYGTGIDATVTCSSDHWDGRTLSDIPHGEVAGAHLRAEEKVSSDGINAVIYAYLQILSGHYDTMLVVATCKESQTVGHIIENLAFDPAFQQQIDLDFLSAAALQANSYIHKYGITPEQRAQVVVKNRKNAKDNPFAQLTTPVTTEQVLNSEMLAYPLRSLETKPVSDGACGLILATEEKARKLTRTPAWIAGIGQCYESHYLGDRDLATCEALTLAAKNAYRQAGITDPLKHIDIAEISEYFSYQELLWTEGMGFCDKGQGGKLVDKGITGMGGKIPVNPSGGILSGNPTLVAGMARVVEVALQLMGNAVARQIPRAKTGLAHGTYGPCGQHQAVLILKS